MQMVYSLTPGFCHLCIDNSISLNPIHESNAHVLAFNFKKAHWDKFQKFIIEEHPPPLLVEA